MDVAQVINTTQFVNLSDLDLIVARFLKNLSGPLSGLDRILNRACGLNDIKGRAEIIARLSAIVAFTTLSREYEREIKNLERKITFQFESNKSDPAFENQPSSYSIARMKDKYSKLSTEINVLYETIPYSEIAGKSAKEINAILLSDSMKKLLILKRYLGMSVTQDMDASVRQALEVLAAIVKYATAMKNTEATLYTEKGVLTGFIHHLEEERLSDLLNDISNNSTKLGTNYLEFSKPAAESPEGGNTTTVKKTSINLLTLSDFNAGRGIGAKEGIKVFPFVSKKRIAVELKTAEYSLVGDIYCKPGQIPEDLLKDTSDFISLTNVSIHLPNEDFSYSIPYAAVNKGRIIAITRRPAFFGS